MPINTARTSNLKRSDIQAALVQPQRRLIRRCTSKSYAVKAYPPFSKIWFKPTFVLVNIVILSIFSLSRTQSLYKNESISQVL